MLVWICIGGSLIFYFLVGYHVFRSRNQFRSFSTSRNSREDTQPDTTQISVSKDRAVFAESLLLDKKNQADVDAEQYPAYEAS